jgi:hypothetical protein
LIQKGYPISTPLFINKLYHITAFFCAILIQ